MRLLFSRNSLQIIADSREWKACDHTPMPGTIAMTVNVFFVFVIVVTMTQSTLCEPGGSRSNRLSPPWPAGTGRKPNVSKLLLFYILGYSQARNPRFPRGRVTPPMPRFESDGKALIIVTWLYRLPIAQSCALVNLVFWEHRLHGGRGDAND